LVRVYLASFEADKEINKYIDYRLVSYLSHKSLNDDFWKQSENFKSLIVDSGAFTFFNAAGKGRKQINKKVFQKLDPVKYTTEYCEWIIKHKKNIDYFVELDLDKIYGWDKQLELRKIFEDYNLTPIYVWHYTNKMSWEEMCKKYDYVGIGSSGRRRDLSFLLKKLKVAEKYGTKCHIFGYSRINELSKLSKMKSLFSVDSSSWGAGIKYGVFYYFDGRNLQMLGKDKFVKKFGKRFGGLDSNEIQKWNVTQWNNYSNYLVSQEEK